MSIANNSINFDSTMALSSNFQPTQWSLIRRAGDSDSPQSHEALETLCRKYWLPIYSFIRRNGRAPHDAQDLTQEFFVRLLEKKTIGGADPRIGKFRTFLLAALKNFLTDAYRKANASKRGGGREIVSFEEAQAENRYQLEPVDHRTPDKVFEQRWTVVLLEAGMARLRDEFRDSGKERQFEALKGFLSTEGDLGAYEQVATELNTSAKTVAVAVHRIRRRFRQVVRSGIADTVSTPDEVEEEYQSLFA